MGSSWARERAKELVDIGFACDVCAADFLLAIRETIAEAARRARAAAVDIDEDGVPLTMIAEAAEAAVLAMLDESAGAKEGT